MKKTIIILFIISLIFIFNNNDTVIIPSNAIRFRIIANSDTLEDQNIKNSIKNDLINNILPEISQVSNVDESKQAIVQNMPKIENILKNYDINYKINFGSNYFPKKEYKGITYDAGNYESLVITLDKGMGKNWWCVLYPPLCLIDSNSTNDKIQYKSLVKEMLDKYSNKMN